MSEADKKEYNLRRTEQFRFGQCVFEWYLRMFVDENVARKNF